VMPNILMSNQINSHEGGLANLNIAYTAAAVEANGRETQSPNG